MSTSLAAQLQKLAVPQTSLLQRDKKRASLLFDQKEAASIDRDTFYEIGISGLRELQDLNADFTVFETSIFSQTSKNVERAVQTKLMNDKLNNNIKRFLMLLSPYFLLKPAHKALEWLINRFLIHEYNQDDFLKLILPYHETNIFVRCLQLFHIFDANSKWHWLRPVQKSGIHLNKITLFNHAANDIGFMKFLSKMIFDAVYVNQRKPNSLTTLYAFYCTTTIGIIERSREITEPQLSAILPPLLKGLSSNIPDYTASAYMITAQVLSKTKLSHKLLNSIVQRIVSDNQKNLRTEATLLLIVLYQSQADHFNTISSSAMQNIAKSDWFAVNLGNFTSAGSYVMPLLIPVLEYALRRTQYEIYQNFIDAILTEVRLDDEGTDIIIRIVLDNCSTTDEEDTDEVDSDSENETTLPTTDKMGWYASLLKKLETQFPCAFDRILTETLTSNTFDKHRQALRTIMNFMISENGDDSSRTIFEKLYHPNAENRLNAVQYLVKNFAKLTDKDREMFEGAANVLLLDDNIQIVSTIASMPKDQLLNLLRENNFVEMSIKVLINCYKNGSSWNTVVLMFLKVICSEERIIKNSKLLFVILPYLIPSNEKDLELASRILTSKCSNYYTFLSKAKSSFKEGMSPTQFGNNIYDNIVSYNNCTNIDFINEFKSLPEKLEIHKYLFVLLLSTNLRHNKGVLNIEYIQQITQFLPSAKIIAKKSTNEVFSFNNALRKNIPPLQGYLNCLKIAIDNIENDQKLRNQFVDLLTPNENVKVLITILSILLKGCQSENTEISTCYTNVMKEFLDKFFPDFKEKINFLANFINVDDSFKIDSKIQLRIILIIYTLLKQSKQSISWTVDTKNNILVPSLLIGLINPLKETREASILVLQLIANCISTLDKTYKPLLQEILSSKEEITLDCNQLPFILGNIFAAENKKYTHFIQIFFDIICDTKTPVHISSSLMTVFSFVSSKDILEQTSKYAINILKQTNNDNILLDLHRSSIVSNVILRINEKTCKQINIKSSSWDLLNTALRHDILNLNQENGKTMNPTILALDQITRDVFANLNQNVQKLLLKTLIEIASSSENPEVVQNIYKTVKKIDLDAKLLTEYLNQMKDLKSVKTLPQRKFRRVSEIPTADLLEMIEWKHGITALEFLQDKKKLSNANILLPILFGILKKCLDFEEQGSVEYPKQITLSAILHVCNKMEAEGLGLPKTAFNMELIVQCIRASQNPQTHHHALLVLAHTATLIPDQVLHNIMAIFTFMGTSVLRHDDAYSFQIIAKIIDTIIPILVKNCSDQKEKNVASVLRVFVDVMLDVPEHRRMPLFQKLLVTLGTENYLWLFLVLVFEANVLHKNVDTPKQDSKNRLVTVEKPKRLDIATNIMLQFSPPVILKTCIKLLEHVKSLPVDKPENLMDTDCVTFNIQQHTGKQFRHYKYTIVTFLSGLLSSKQLVNLFAQLTIEDLLTLEPIYKNLIINILTYIQSVSKTVDKMSQTPQAQYWKVLIHHCYDTMDSINALLTTEMFLLVIRGLIVHNIPTVRRKAMEILNTKLQYQQSFFYTNPEDGEITNTDDLFALIPSLINIIKTVDNECCGETEQELIQQTALLSLKLLIKLLANKNPDKFTSILEFIIDLIKNKKTHGNILASVMLCLAELCSKLRAHAIPGLPRYMPAVIKILKLQQNQETPGLLLLCIITAIQKIVESLPLFLSPYLEKLLTELTVLSAKWDGRRADPKVETFVKKLDAIRSNIGTVIPSRILIPTVASTHSTLLANKQYSAIGPLMNVLAENLANLRGNELSEHLPELTNFFLNSLQFRVDCNSEASLDTITLVEDHIIQTLTALVLKLSETSFRPLYYKLFDWAVRGDVRTERVITFYRLSSGIAENLKALFVLFAGHFIKNASELLDATNSIKNTTNLYFPTDESNHLLIESILTTLRAVFLYDSKNFMDKDRFETLMQPLVDQLENQTGGIKCLIQRGDDFVIPCIAQFAVAIADDALWKQLNYQILLKTRHNHPQIRLIGLKCLCEVARKLGEDFLPLLPETIPFLAELLEDEDENVEKSCQKVVQDLEVILGEPLQKYF